jgi:hypothetical protein
MKSILRSLVLGAVLLITGCAFAPAHSVRLPYDAWYLGFLAPDDMEVWLETADVEDVDGWFFMGAMSGTVAINYGGDPAGWGDRVGPGKGVYVTGADLPKRIYVRWQSLAEPQTYRATLEIPESARRLMRSKVPSMRPPIIDEYRKVLTIGLAPGGWIRAWVMSYGSMPVEVLCQKAEIEPKGPDQGQYEGRYGTLSQRAKAYLKTHSIPYDSWKCPDTASAAKP